MERLKRDMQKKDIEGENLGESSDGGIRERV